jgi:AbrB family looped-hinge helix DNA binding protein
MHATIYGRGQMVIPAKARKEARLNTGDIVNVTTEGDGRLVLLRLEKPKLPRNKIRLLRRKGKHSILTGGPIVTSEQVRTALAESP